MSVRDALRVGPLALALSIVMRWPQCHGHPLTPVGPVGTDRVAHIHRAQTHPHHRSEEHSVEEDVSAHHHQHTSLDRSEFTVTDAVYPSSDGRSAVRSKVLLNTATGESAEILWNWGGKIESLRLKSHTSECTHFF